MTVNYRLVTEKQRKNGETGKTETYYVNVFPGEGGIGKTFSSVSQVISEVQAAVKDKTFGPNTVFKALKLVKTETFSNPKEVQIYPNGQTTFISVGTRKTVLKNLRALKKPVSSKKPGKRKTTTNFVLLVQSKDAGTTPIQKKAQKDKYPINGNRKESLAAAFANVNPATLVKMMLVKTVIKGDGEPSVRRMEFYTTPYNNGKTSKSNYARYVNATLLKRWTDASKLPEDIVAFMKTRRK